MKAVLTAMAVGLGGGTDLVILTAARALLRSGVQVELRTVEPMDRDRVARIFPGEASIPGIEFVATHASPSGSAGWMNRVLRYRRLLRDLWRERGDRIVVNLNGDLLPSPAHLTYVHFPVAAVPRYPEAGPFRSAVSRTVLGTLLRMQNTRALRRVHPRFLANSSFTQRALRESLGVEAEVLFPPVRLFLPRPPDAVRSDAVITVASFRSWKRLERILEVAERVPGVPFAVVGASGPRGPRIVDELRRVAAARGLADRVSLEADVPRAALERRYWTSKIYLHPTPLEHFGISMVEAMRAGCVPVVPRSGGQWTDVLEARDGTWGFGYETPEEAATAIRSLLADPARASRISGWAQDRAQAFTEDRFARSFVRAFQEVAAPASQ